MRSNPLEVVLIPHPGSFHYPILFLRPGTWKRKRSCKDRNRRSELESFSGWLAAGNCHPDRILFLSLPSGVVREVVVNDWPQLSNVDWSADGEGLFMPSTTSDSTPVLLLVDREGKARVIWEGQKYGLLLWAIPSPDGRYVALNLYVGETNVWMIENF